MVIMTTVIPGAVLLASWVAAMAGEPASVPERAKYLLLDARIIDRTDNARLAVGTVKKHPAKALFREDKPWEPRFDNLYAFDFY